MSRGLDGARPRIVHNIGCGPRLEDVLFEYPSRVTIVVPPSPQALRPRARRCVTVKYIVDSKKTVEQASFDLEVAVKQNGFGVLHVHDLQETLRNKGVEFDHACRIFEVCNPQKAKAVLVEDPSLNMALPCRISVWEESGTTKIGMIRPKAMLAMLSDSPGLVAVADEVERTVVKIIEDAR
jgi:uncharacterized protein (DUF302 family)